MQLSYAFSNFSAKDTTNKIQLSNPNCNSKTISGLVLFGFGFASVSAS